MPAAADVHASAVVLASASVPANADVQASAAVAKCEGGGARRRKASSWPARKLTSPSSMSQPSKGWFCGLQALHHTVHFSLEVHLPRRGFVLAACAALIGATRLWLSLYPE